MAFTVQNLPQQQRVSRRPSHAFNLKHEPFTIQPFLIAPVIPGETMKNLLLQSRVVSDPIKSSLIGWWIEYYVFYVKHTDLSDRETFKAMMLDMSTDLTGLASPARVKTYHPGGYLDWVSLCLDRVVEEYFREDHDIDPPLVAGMPVAKINQETWLQSVMSKADFEAGDTTLTGGESQTELDRLRTNYEFLLQNRLVQMTYEDFLKTYGVRGRDVEEPHRPELVRFVRDWTYPTNTIDPTNGAPSSAVSWAVAERADKDRFFSEPGFLFGVTVARPKVYLKNQVAPGASMMRDALRWLPALMRDEVYTSLMEFATGVGANGPLGSNPTGDYVIDVRDLLLYGDQFVNYDFVTDGENAVVLPDASLNRKYPTAADIDALFVDPTKNRVRQDGVVSLHILGTQVDHS